MQVDMHYYGTFAMARAAGLNAETCKTIATAAQFVDDNAFNKSMAFKDCARLDIISTAHHCASVKNINDSDQRYVWVPFHFLPGNEGIDYTERLICRQNSDIAKEMIEHHLSKANEPYAVTLIGIAAHVYADTFSHYGFSGVSSRRNEVDNFTINLHDLSSDIEKYIKNKTDDFFTKNGPFGGVFDNIKAVALDAIEKLSGALGHGAVATYPDRPYLKWDFVYEQYGKKTSHRDNHETFLIACEELHSVFCRFASARADLVEFEAKPFSEIKKIVSNVLSTQAKCDGRIEAWQKAASSGDLFPNGSEIIPSYSEDTWHNQREAFSEMPDSRAVLQQDVFRFYQAASIHRTYVLRDLLPKHDLLID